MLNPFYHYLSALVFLLIGIYFYQNSTLPILSLLFLFLVLFQLFLARAVVKFKAGLDEERENH